MTVEIVMGNRNNIKATEELIEAINTLDVEGSLYLGYPHILKCRKKPNN